VHSKDARIFLKNNDCDVWFISIVVPVLFPFLNMPRKKQLFYKIPYNTDD
jgi:hypothetical protein